MVRHLVAGLLVLLALAQAAEARRPDEPITIPSDVVSVDCGTGGLLRYPSYVNRGLSMTLGFRAQGDPDADYAALDRLLVGFRRMRFAVNDSTVLALTSPTVVGREAVDRLIRQACQIERLSPFRLSGARTVDIRESRRAQVRSEARDAARARAERAAERRRAAEERALQRLRLRMPPTPEELTPLLRGRWEDLGWEAVPAEVREGFSRVRDVRCRRREGVFHCRVGLLATSARGPEYGQVDLRFARRPDGTVEYLPNYPPL